MIMKILMLMRNKSKQEENKFLQKESQLFGKIIESLS